MLGQSFLTASPTTMSHSGSSEPQQMNQEAVESMWKKMANQLNSLGLIFLKVEVWLPVLSRAVVVITEETVFGSVSDM